MSSPEVIESEPLVKVDVNLVWEGRVDGETAGLGT